MFSVLKLIDKSFFPKWVGKTLCSAVGICWGSSKAQYFEFRIETI